jgi:hypothetical protein
MSSKSSVADPYRGTSTLVRPKFSPGLLLRDDDLSAGVDYTRDLSRLLFSHLFGCGVVCGLVVQQKVACGKLVVTIASGLALTCRGDPVQVPRPVEIKLDPTCGKPLPPELWVTLCRNDKSCAPRSAVCGCDDEDDASVVCTREMAAFEVRLTGEAPRDFACQCPRPVAAARPKARAEEGTGGTTRSARPNRRSGMGTSTGTSAPSPAPPAGTGAAPTPHDCACADPCDPCNQDHYAGVCGCDCCDGDCVVLAVLTRTDDGGGDIGTWDVSHKVRRFIRPVLMRDPQVWREEHDGEELCKLAGEPKVPNERSQPRNPG